MKLMKEIAKEIGTYKTFLESLVEKSDGFQKEINEEKRLGIQPTFEADYYQRDTRSDSTIPAQVRGDDTVNFKPQGPVEKPVQHPNANRVPQRIHLIYDPQKGKVMDAMKTDMRARPPAEYMEANAEQVQGAMRHIEGLNPKLAELLQSGKANIWIPRVAAQTGQQEPIAAQGTGTGGTTIMKMDPERLKKAQAAAGEMSLAK